MPTHFVLLGYVFVGVIVVLAVFFATGYYYLTAVELVTFLLILSRLVVCLRNTGPMVHEEGPGAACRGRWTASSSSGPAGDLTSRLLLPALGSC